MTYAFVGTNWYALKVELDKLVDSFIAEHGDLALERIDCEEKTYQQLAEAVESLPFLATKKMVVASNLSNLKEGTEYLHSLIRKTGDTTDLVIIESKVDKRSSYYKQLKKLETFHEFNDPDQFELVRWVQSRVQELKGKISSSDARYLVERVGTNQTLLNLELEKLAQYRREITKAYIEELTEETPTSTIFNLIEGAFAGNTKKALKIYGEQRAQRVEPQAILAMMVWQMHVVSIIAYAPHDYSAEKIASDANLNPYVVKKSQSIAHRMGRVRVDEVMELLRNIDRDSKSKAINYDDTLKYLIVSLEQ